MSQLTQQEIVVFNNLLGQVGQLMLKQGNEEIVIRVGEAKKKDDLFKARKPYFPPILFNTLPKSGSLYVYHTLGAMLAGGMVRISSSTFPDDLIIRKWFDEFIDKHGLTQEHLPAHPINLYHLSKSLDKMVLHIRDPRESLVSWTHHVRKLFKEDRRDEIGTIVPILPEGYIDWSHEKQISWQIENHMPAQIKWINDWLDAIQSPTFKTKVLLTQYSEFKADNEAFIRKILRFYDLEKYFNPDLMKNKKAGQHNFRTGGQSKWQDDMTPDQQLKITKQIPDRLIDRFHWLP